MTRLYHAFGFLIGAIASMAENADTCMTHEALVKARNLTRPDDPATVAKRAKAKAKKLEADKIRRRVARATARADRKRVARANARVAKRIVHPQP